MTVKKKPVDVKKLPIAGIHKCGAMGGQAIHQFAHPAKPGDRCYCGGSKYQPR